MTDGRLRVALVQRVIPHYNLVFYRKLLASSAYSWEFLYGPHPGGEESGLAADAARELPTRPIENRLIGKAVWQRGVTRWMREQRYAAVVFEGGWQIVSNAWLPFVAHRAGTAAIPWSKGIAESGAPRPAWRRWVESSFTRQCDAMVVYGRVSAEYFRAYGYPSDRIFVAQNTVDVRSIVSGIPGDRSAAGRLRSRFDLTDELVFGYFGRLVEQKRVDRIIQAFADVWRSGLKMRLVIAGDGPERAALETQARATEARSAIIFCGRVPEAEAGHYFELFDVVITANAAGLAILEAMAHGKVNLIVPERRPETELIRDRQTGIVTADDSAPGLAAGIQRAAAAVRSGNKVGHEAQATVLREATMEGMVEAFDRAVECGIRRRKSR